jgi:hypothetical protein
VEARSVRSQVMHDGRRQQGAVGVDQDFAIVQLQPGLDEAEEHRTRMAPRP